MYLLLVTSSVKPKTVLKLLIVWGSGIRDQVVSPRIALATNIVLVLLKVFAYALTSATVTLIEMLRSVGDLLNGALVYTGTRLAAQPYDRLRYPFGRGRCIYLFGYTTSILALGFIAALGFVEGMQSLLHPITITNRLGGIALLTIAMFFDGLTLTLAYRDQRKFIAGYGDSNPLLRALIAENSIDIASESIAIAALGLSTLSSYIDGAASIALSVLLAASIYHIARDSVEALLGRAAPPHVIARLVKLALSIPGVVDVNDVKSMIVEPGRYLVIVQLELDPKLSVEDVEDIENELYNYVKRYLPSVSHVIVEIRKADSCRYTHRALLSAIARLRS